METYRLTLDAFECLKIKKALIRHREHEGNALMWAFGDADFVVHRIQMYSKRGQVVKFYDKDNFVGILMFEVGTFWWSTGIFLNEMLVLCVDEHYKGFQREAVKQLEWLAKAYDVNAISAGCLFSNQPNMAVNGYRKDGYDVECPAVVKIRRPHKPMKEEWEHERQQ